MLKPLPAYCVDASVGVKWFLRGEAKAAGACRLLEAFVMGRLDLVVPELFFYEMASALSVAVSRLRVAEAVGLAALEELDRLSLSSVALHGLMGSVLIYSQRLGVSPYDAAYLATAERRQVPLVTCDARLLKAAAGAIDWVLDIDQVDTGPSSGLR